MKSLILFFLGLITISSSFYLINPTELQLSSFYQVFAQSEDRTKNFDDAITIHSSETISSEKTRINIIQEKNFDDIIITNTSDISTNEKSKDDTGKTRNFDEAIQSQSSDTSTMGNKNKDKTSFIGRLSSGESSKIHPAISHILKHSNPQDMAKIFDASIENDHLYVYVHLTDKKIQNKSLDIEILAQDKNIIVSKLSLSKIQSLATLDYVERITLPEHAVFYGHAESEGVSFSMADDMHAAGFTGSGINVAVIDDSFFINNTEISSNIVHSQLFDSQDKCGDIACSQLPFVKSHGTAVAEIVVDMAPDVNLLLYTIFNSVDFSNAVDDAMARGADIITASLGFPSQGGDGTNVNKWYRDGTSPSATLVNEVTANGTLFTVSAGNSGSSHWNGTYVPVNSADLVGTNLQFDLDETFTVVYESVMMFNSSGSGAFQACLPISDDGGVYSAAWNAWPRTFQDYDVLLYASNMTKLLLTGSFFPQDPSFLKPYESFETVLPRGDVCLVLASYISDENHKFHIDIGSNTFRDSSYMIPAVSIDTPADSSGAFSVGAVNFNNTSTNYSDDTLEVFSSQGPTEDGRLKPEICGPDGTLTHQTVLTNGGGFFGTSASTPHVAGAAALLLEQTPTLTVDQLRQKLIDNARFDVDFSQDNLCGSDSGSLSLFDPPACQNVPSSGTWTVEESCTLAKNSSMGNLIVQNSSSLKLDSGVTLNLDSADDLSIKPSSSLLIKSGASLTFTGLLPPCVVPVSGDWEVSFDCNMIASDVAPGNVTVKNNAILTILSGVTFDINQTNSDLIIMSGGQVLVKSGGSLLIWK